MLSIKDVPLHRYKRKVEKSISSFFYKAKTEKGYTFTDDYSYIGFKSDNGAIYFTSIEVVWR